MSFLGVCKCVYGMMVFPRYYSVQSLNSLIAYKRRNLERSIVTPDPTDIVDSRGSSGRRRQ